jgi:hypothetical protein
VLGTIAACGFEPCSTGFRMRMETSAVSGVNDEGDQGI